MGKWTGAVFQMIAAGFLIAAGAAHGPEGIPLLVFGLGSGVAGLWSWDRGARKQLLPPSPKQRPEADVSVQIARLEDVLASMQTDVQKLTEDREFYQRLYEGDRTGSAGGLPARPTG